jgi:phage terminase large subunit-like protein
VGEGEGVVKVTLDDLLGDDFDEYTLKYLLEDERIATLVRQLTKPIHTFQPRPDDVANYDEQSKFVNDVWNGIKVCVAGNACIAGESLVFDPVAGGYRRVDSVSGDWWVRAWDEQNKCWVVARALKPFVKGVADLYRVRLSNGCELVCTDQHRVLASEFGFQRVCELSHSQSIGDISLVGFPLGVARSCRTVPDCRDDCLRDSHQCGERLLAGQDSGLASVPLRGGVLECSRCDCGLGDRLGLLQECSHSCLSSSHLSIDHSLRAEHLGHALENGCSELCSRRDSQVVLECLDLESQPFDRFGCRSDRPDKAGGLVRSVRGCTCDWDGSVALEDVRIVSIEFLRKDEFYDFTVPIYHNYELAGIVNHNSGKTEAAAYMVSKFLLETPAPRDLCPFLVVSQNYDMCGAIYQEKLKKYLEGSGEGGSSMIESVRWRNINRQFPAEVILKPNHINGNRHVIQFASYEQGRQAFQAISASGWWCDEQADLGLIQELFVRVREFDSPLMLYTLTPLEPDYALEDLWKRRSEFKVAATWRFYSMNTMCNTTLSPQWRKNFFDVVPDDMQATRQLGAFARFEGLIYKEFRDEVHLVKPKYIPVDAVHYRSIDFGYRNMACLWGCLVKGAWWIYDELLIHDTLTEDFAQLILDRSEKWGWKAGDIRFSTTYADWEDPAGMVRMRDRGVYCSPARKEVGAGIDCVRQKFIGVDKCPQLYIFDTCTELIRELKEYSWMAGPKNPINRVDSKEAPVKFHDHCVDALRYLIYSREAAVVKAWAPVEKKEKKRSMFGR